MSLSLSGLRLFVIPSLMESLLKYRRPYDAYDGTQTKKKSETTPAAPVGDLEVSASGTRLAIYLCSNRHVSDRQAIALRGEIDYSMRQKRVTMKTVEVESRLEMANVSVAASYDVFSSTSEVELVSPCFLQVASSTKAETGQFVNGFIGSLHCRLDIRDIPLIRSCLSRVSVRASARLPFLFLESSHQLFFLCRSALSTLVLRTPSLAWVYFFFGLLFRSRPVPLKHRARMFQRRVSRIRTSFPTIGQWKSISEGRGCC